jgi:hypothetical protein
MSLKELITEFNNTAISLAEQLSTICPNTVISNNVSNLKMLIGHDSEKLIELFTLYVLPDKAEIDSGNADYFMGKIKKEKKTDENEALIKDAFEFKHIWNKLDDMNKTFVIQYMQCLCYYAQQYFLLKY